MVARARRRRRLVARPDGVPALVLRRHERTVMGVGKARMAGRYPIQVEHERGQRPHNRCSTVRRSARLSGGPTSCAIFGRAAAIRD